MCQRDDDNEFIVADFERQNLGVIVKSKAPLYNTFHQYCDQHNYPPHHHNNYPHYHNYPFTTTILIRTKLVHHHCHHPKITLNTTNITICLHATTNNYLSYYYHDSNDQFPQHRHATLA